MGTAQRRFIVLLVAVSGIAALAVALLIRGLEHDLIGVAVAGALLAVCAALGVVALGRIVFVTERDRGR